MRKLENKTAIVTGAGAGIGKHIALLFAKQGARVVASDIDAKNVQEVVDAIKSGGGQAEAYKADVSDEDQIKALVKFTRDTYGAIDIIVNNAGIMDDFMPVTEVQPDKWDQVIRVNLNSIYYMCHHAVPEMQKAGKGAIVNVASVGGLGGGKAGAAYTASKHGVIGLSKSIAYMYATQGIRCNVIAPGGVDTTIAAKMNPSQFGYERVSLGIGSVPRSGRPEEIANIAVFLASDDSSFVNGVVVTADGGWTAY